ncbi:MAG TPA: hypothetical protein VLM11_23075 [Streptosporangiaceae bacterium]|nr:hypothetical protein [Streptosporangiaceae bacterium]
MLLLVVFEALIAAGIPLLLAATAVWTAVSLLAIPSRWLPVGSTSSSVVLLIGMAVGVDDSLFYVVRPVVAGGIAALALGALAPPALGMHLASPGIYDLPKRIPVVHNLFATQQAFPGGPAPAEVVVTGQNPSDTRVRRALAGLEQRAATSAELRQPVTATLLDHGHVLVVSVPLAGSGTDATSNKALATLRNQVMPATFGRVSGTSYAVAGETAGNRDSSVRLGSRTPLVFLFVLGLAFLLQR